MTATLEQRIAKAEDAYNNAQSFDDWKQAAKLLFGVRKRPKKPRRARGKGRYPFPVASAVFADGRTRRMTFWSAAGNPLDWKRAERLCNLSYKNHYGLATPPPIVCLSDEISGEVAYSS